MAINNGEYCVVNEDSGEAIKCYRSKVPALRLMRALYANVDDADMRSLSETVDDVYSRYHQVVNMSASELERWSQSDCSNKASLSRAPIQRNLHLLKTPKEKWGDKEVRWAKRTISFVSRMKAMDRGKPVSPSCPSKRDISLMNWAYRPSSSRADIRAFDVPLGARCVRSSPDGRDEVLVLAMPYDVVDTFNTYFSRDTDVRSDITPEHQPVFDAHGLRGDELSVEPIGYVAEWAENEEGRWARVKLYQEHPRFADFMRAAAECKLGASVGMLRAGMFPQPPINGVYDSPTLLLQAPIVELSLIISEEGFTPSNPAAFAGIEMRNMCKDCQENAAVAKPSADEKVAELLGQLQSMRAELEEVAKQRDEAIRAINDFKKQKQMDQFASRMSAMGVPQAVIDDLMGIFDDIAEGSHDKLIAAVGKMIDHIRSSTNSNPSLRGDAQRGAALSTLTRQFASFEPETQAAMVDKELIAKDIADFRRLFMEAEK